MLKNRFVSGTILFILVSLLVGCGIPQDQYQLALTDLNKTKTELQSAQSTAEATQAKLSELTSTSEKTAADLRTAQARVSELTAELEKTKADLQTAQADLKSTQSKLQSAETEFKNFKADLNSLYGPLYTTLAVNDSLMAISGVIVLNQKDTIPTKASVMTTRVTATGDAELKSYWQQAYVTETSRRLEVKLCPA